MTTAGNTPLIRIATIDDAARIGGLARDAYFIDNIAVDPRCQAHGLGRCLIEYAVAEANRLRLPALRLYTNEMMTENLSMYAHIGFVETHRADEKSFHRVYMRWSLPKREEGGA